MSCQWTLGFELIISAVLKFVFVYIFVTRDLLALLYLPVDFLTDREFSVTIAPCVTAVYIMLVMHMAIEFDQVRQVSPAHVRNDPKTVIIVYEASLWLKPSMK